MFCKKHNTKLKCLPGHSAHPNNWYCPICDGSSMSAAKTKPMDFDELWSNRGFLFAYDGYVPITDAGLEYFKLSAEIFFDAGKEYALHEQSIMQESQTE